MTPTHDKKTPLKLKPTTAEAKNNTKQVIECAAAAGGFRHPRVVKDGKTVAIHTRQELHALYEVTLGLHDHRTETPTPQVQGHILQCGTYRGVTAAVLALANQERRNKELVVTIDRFQYHTFQDHAWARGVLEAQHSLFETLNIDRSVVSIIHDDLTYIQNFWNTPVRIALLDSAHAYRHLTKQIALIVPRIITGGWLIVHDYNTEKHEGVTQAVNEWLQTAQPLCVLWSTDDFLFVNLH